MKKLLFGLVAILFMSIMAEATTGYLKSEEVSGMNKVCYYDVLGSIYTLNIKSYALCPLSHEFN